MTKANKGAETVSDTVHNADTVLNVVAPWAGCCTTC
jgi:hypothetical protein